MTPLMILLGFSALLIGAGFLPTEQDTAEEDIPEEDTVEDQTLSGSEGEAHLLVGGAGNDLLTGDAGEADSLVGGEGDDTLVVAEDNIVTGGAGSDTFRLGVNGLDGVITDFNPDEDVVDVRNGSNERDYIDLFLSEDGTGLYIAANDWPTALIHLPNVTLEEGQTISVVFDGYGDAGPERHELRPVGVLPPTYLATFGTTEVELLQGTAEDDWIFATEWFNLSEGHDTVLGGEGDDHLFSGNDEFYNEYRNHSAGLSFFTHSTGVEMDGEGGDDTLWLGAADTVTGGTGADSFHVIAQYTPESSWSGEITDFQTGEDQLVIHHAVAGSYNFGFPTVETADALSTIELTYDAGTNQTSVMIGDWLVARLNGDQTTATVAATNGEDFDPTVWLDASGNAITEEVANAADILLVAGSQEGVFWENS